MASKSGAVQENKQNERVQLLSDLASSLLLSDNPREILDEVFKRLSAHLGLEAYFNYLVAEDGSRLRLYNYAGVPEHIAREIEWLDYGQAVCGCVARDKERIIAEDVQCSADPRTGLIKSLGITAYCCHPLIAHDKLIGTLSFGTRNRTKFAQDEIELMRIVSNLIASVLERKRVEEALKLTQFALDNFGESAIWLTKDGRIVYVNQAACRSLGYSREELLSMHIWDIDPNYPREGIWELWSVRKLDHYTKFESTHVAHDGRVFPVEVTSSFTRYGDEEYLITFDRDITERKRAEEALRGALLEASRFREAMENVSAYIYMKDLQSRYIYANKPTLELFGCSTEELVGSGDDRFFPPETVKRLREVDLRVFAGERTYEEIDVADTGSGRRVYLEIKTPIYEDLDRKTICGLLGISTDITERKRAEEALRESEKQYRGIVEDQTELICLYDLEGKITFVNDAYCRYFGKNREELIGHTFMPLIVEEDREAVKAGIAGLTPENPLVTIEQRALLPDGSVAWQEWKNRIVFDRQGRPTGYQAVGRDITERKRAEESLRKSEKFLDSVFEGIQEGISILDKDMNIIKVNHAMKKWYSHMLPLVGKKCYQAYHGRTSACEVCPSLRAMKEKTMQTDIVPYISESGFAGWMELYSSPLKDDQGNVIGVIEHVRDVTERKRAEKALRESESRLSLAQQAGHVGVFDWDLVTNKAVWTPELEDIFGIPHGQFENVYDGWAKRVHPEDLPRVEKFFKDWMQSGRDNEEWEYRFIKNGEVRWISARGQIFYDQIGKPLRMIGTNVDITERKRAEEALKRAEEFTHSTLDSLPSNIAVLDESGTIVFANRQWMKFGRENDVCPVESIDVGSNYFRVCREAKGPHSDEAPDAMRGMLSVLNGEKDNFELEYPCHSPDKKRWFTMRVAPIKAGTFHGIIVAHTDITRRKLSEEALADEKARAELYIDLMGHDINNYNQIAMGYLELIDGIVEDEKLKELVAKPIDAISSSSHLIDNVRNLQKARTGQYKAKAIDLDKILSRLKAQYSKVPGKNVTISYTHDPGCVIVADSLIKDVFSNLIWNAIKHSHSESVQINLELKRCREDGREYCQVIVEDDGPGIPDELKEKIFTRFKRGDKKASGKGLGLYLVKTLVESYHGKVWAEDRIKGDHTKGAKFVVMLPAVKK
jgi:PAS domain S-box-containing protein